ncbi:efflux RND transporter periplasmic adaptor subunit [Dysgonomonas sp. 216]|uniref:efflux RND transporter periplasmic adaptor subunit n=1 Tax=Dysgonomonas sp. 216 TaxID=2302934 RepID=UPI0013CFE516|nr:efflux RND transporter periplasmic adaptor subunit [Dysgonomonas sp. 216]NDW18463.1 efflux RND transporter periplasmic adaptor subunit [Dysgonomonas sp. 216]
MNKKYVIVGGIIVIAILAFVFWPKGGKTQTVLTTEKVKRGNLTTTVTATGTVEPITLVEIGTQVSGVISKIYVDYNSDVTAGQVIAELDKRMLDSELRTAQASLQSKQVELQQQIRNYNRNKELWEKQAISKADWEDVQTAYETAKLAVTSSEAAVFKANTNLGYATIYSTIDGVVVSRAVEEGQTVAASFSTPTLFTIANDLTKMRVIANVDEADIGQVIEGQRVTFNVDAYPNDEFEGKVVQVRLEATTTSNVVTYEVVIDAPNPDLKLKPGLTANVSIYTLEENNVLMIPTKAMRFNPDPEIIAQVGDGDIEIQNNSNVGQGKKTVWVKNGNNLSQKEISIGTSDGINIQILTGLSDGEEVVTGISQKTDMPAMPENGGESSPFMPQRPGGNKKK